TELFDRYIPNVSEVGVFFSPQSYYLAWSQEGTADRIANGIMGYSRALSKCSIPLVHIEETHLDELDKLKVLFMPRVIVTAPETEEKLIRFVENGGTLVVESECGAFSPAGIYRYPEERFLTRLGLTEIGRRNLKSDLPLFRYGGRNFKIGVEQWHTPIEGDDFCTVKTFGKGKVVYFASYPGNVYRQNWNPDFEELLFAIIRDSKATLPVTVLSPERGEKDFLYLKSGKSGDKTVLFAFFPPKCDRAEIVLSDELFPNNRATELFSNRSVEITPCAECRTMTLLPGKWQLAIYVG
ncbi:MAG: hypothetical protein LBM70_09390, partial [Victivallales bacterium]|nr:hypothetical protein [Victivallales bacterium]